MTHGAEKGFKGGKKWDPDQAWQFGNREWGVVWKFLVSPLGKEARRAS